MPSTIRETAPYQQSQRQPRQAPARNVRVIARVAAPVAVDVEGLPLHLLRVSKESIRKEPVRQQLVHKDQPELPIARQQLVRQDRPELPTARLPLLSHKASHHQTLLCRSQTLHAILRRNPTLLAARLLLHHKSSRSQTPPAVQILSQAPPPTAPHPTARTQTLLVAAVVRQRLERLVPSRPPLNRAMSNILLRSILAARPSTSTSTRAHLIYGSSTHNSAP